MSKKSDSYYFQNFIECVECGCQAAKMLEGNLNHFDTGFYRTSWTSCTGLNMTRTRKSMR